MRRLLASCALFTTIAGAAAIAAAAPAAPAATDAAPIAIDRNLRVQMGFPVDAATLQRAQADSTQRLHAGDPSWFGVELTNDEMDLVKKRSADQEAIRPIRDLVAASPDTFAGLRWDRDMHGGLTIQTVGDPSPEVVAQITQSSPPLESRGVV